jgi:hypothetical protein
MSWMHLCRSVAHGLGPYTVIAVLIPGGTLVALLIWMYRRHRNGQHRKVAAPAVPARAVPATRVPTPASSTSESYSPAIANAKAWLGDRYLLAQPIHPPARKRIAGAFGRPRLVPSPPQAAPVAMRSPDASNRAWPADAIPEGTRALFAVAPRRERTHVESA